MFLRDTSAPTISLSDIYDQIGEPGQVINCLTHQVQVTLTDDEAGVRIFENGEVRKELPLAGALDAFGSLVQAPAAFLGRLDPDMQQYLINEMLRRKQGPIDIRYGDDCIHDAFPAGRKHIDPRSVIDVANVVVGEDARVVDWWSNPWDFRLDVVVPDTSRTAVYGDPVVDDFTLGGLRFEQDTKHNLAPTVQEFWYRLACTNGYEYVDLGQKVDLRSHDEEDFLIEFEALAAMKMRTVTDKIRSFYDLRNQSVANVEQTILRHAQENSLTDRVTLRLVELAPSYIADESEATMFDIVNLFTNVAVDPKVKGGTRQALERMGGSICADHAARCLSCSARLTV